MPATDCPPLHTRLPLSLTVGRKTRVPLVSVQGCAKPSQSRSGRMAAAAPDSARFTGVLSSARGSPSRAPSRTPRATVVDAFAKYAVFSSAGASSIKGGTALIDAVIRRRVVRLEVGDGGRLQDAHFSVPAENSRWGGSSASS